jgi:hypothetical protein
MGPEARGRCRRLLLELTNGKEWYAITSGSVRMNLGIPIGSEILTVYPFQRTRQEETIRVQVDDDRHRQFS